MPSTYDPLLRLELQATGENATTWGIKTNTNLDLLAESIAGAVNLNIAGSGDYTLSTANGAEDEARQAILVLTGTLTGNRNIIVPSSPKNYTVINNTSGAFTVTLKQSSGSGLTVLRPGPTITVCTSTTCVDAIGATAYTKNFLAATSVAPAVSALGLANTATLVATSVGSALITAVDTSAGRATLGATSVGSAVFTASTQAAARAAIDVSSDFVGMVAHFATSAAPTGWVAANGALISRTTYAALFAHATAAGLVSEAAWAAGEQGRYSSGDGSTNFRVPDLRGEFIRGWDDGRGIDSGRVRGSLQLDSFQGHHHTVVQDIGTAATGGIYSTAGSVFASLQTAAFNAKATTITTDGTNGTPRTAAETRPRNLALLACIKI